MPLDIKYIQGKILTIEVLLLSKENKLHKKILNGYLEYYLELSYRLQTSKHIHYKKEKEKIVEIDNKIEEFKGKMLHLKKEDSHTQIEILGMEV